MNPLWNRGSYGSCCVVPHCSMRSGTNSLSEVKSFRLPRCDERRTAWLKAMNRQDRYRGYSRVICSKHFIKGCPSRDPNDPDYIPSIFPMERIAKKPEKRKPLQRKRMAQKGNEKNRVKSGASKKKKKAKPKKPVDSESTCTNKNAQDNLAVISSDHGDSGDAVFPSARSSIPETEFVLVGKRTVDVNYFVECLRRVNKHNTTMPCSMSDMIICEEQVKGNQRGIVFRCKICLFSNIIWVDDAIAMATTPDTRQANKNASDHQIRNELYSVPGIKDLISPKPTILPKLPIPRKPGRNLPVQSPAPAIVQSHVPLIGYSQVGPLQNSLSRDGASSSFTDSPIVEMKFCVEEQPMQQENTSKKWTAKSKKSRASTRIALSPRTISKRHAEHISSTATQSKRPSSVVLSQLPNSEPGKITLIPNSLPDTSILQTQSEGASTAGPKTIILTPGDLQKILSLSNSLPGQGTTTPSVRQLFVPQIQSVQSVPGTSATSRSILLPPSVLVSSSQSTSVQSVASKYSSPVSETITPDISIPYVLPVDLNLVKKEKNGTETFQPSRTLSPATIMPESITPDISVAGALPVDLNLVKKEVG